MVPILSTMGNVFNRVSFWGRQHAPQLLTAGGIISGVACAVTACIATTKMNNVIGEAQADLEAIEKTKNDPDVKPEEYTEESYKKDKMKVYLRTAGKTTVLYAPSLLLGGASIGCILGGSGILNQRNASLAAGLAASTASAKELKDRIIERYGEDVYNELKYGIKSIESKEKIVDENGKSKTVKKEIMVVDENKTFEGYQRSFDNMNPYWDKDISCNWMFLRFRQSYWNDKLIADKYVFLNDVLESLGFPKTRAGQEVGWVYSPSNSNGDNYIDFRAVEVVLNEASGKRAILLDFNVDGSVINKAKWEE